MSAGQPWRASPADAEDVARLLRDFHAEFDVPSPPQDVLAAHLRTVLAGEDALALLAGRPPVGLAVLTVRPGVWAPGPVLLVEELYVVPDRRSEGIGTTLVEAVKALADERGSPAIEVNVDEPDVDARRFYERHGFVNTEGPDTERYLHYRIDR